MIIKEKPFGEDILTNKALIAFVMNMLKCLVFSWYVGIDGKGQARVRKTSSPLDISVLKTT